uniref:Uncharacterized protein n=1 Tax=Glossina brevipalpis TaxID=37001 RepID=A0A1A9X478_9MUSC
MDRPYAFGSFEERLNRSSSETVKQREKNQMNNLALGKCKISTSNVGAFPISSAFARENGGGNGSGNRIDINRPSFFPNIAAIRTLFKEERKSFPTSDVLNETNTILTRRKSITEQNMDESETDIDNALVQQKNKRRTINPNSVSFQYSFGNDSARSKTSSVQSFQETYLDKSSLNRTSSSQILRESANISTFENDKDVLVPYEPNNFNNLNVIMLMGLFVGLLISKALQYLQLYFRWFLYQIAQLRNALLGTTSIWEFVNLDDNKRFRARTKLLLIPIIAACSLMYGLISVLHFVTRFLLTVAPNTLTNFVQKLQNT